MIRKKTKSSKITLDLTGPQGNAFCLLGYAENWSKKLGLDSKKVIEEMESSDYENLVNVFDKYFGEYFILER